MEKVYKYKELINIMFGWFFRKKEVETLKKEIQESFEHVKKDFEGVGRWIKHFDNKHSEHNSQFSEINLRLSTVENDLNELKEKMELLNFWTPKRVFKQVFNKQTAVYGVQTPVQTAVQTPKFFDFSTFSITERAIIWILMNSELNLSYEDLSAMLGKSKTTIRGQINSIKQKSGGLIMEQIEKNGKKRIYIPNEIKEKLLKKAKVRIKKEKIKSSQK